MYTYLNSIDWLQTKGSKRKQLSNNHSELMSIFFNRPDKETTRPTLPVTVSVLCFEDLDKLLVVLVF